MSFANRHHLRSRIVPKADDVALAPVQLRLFDFAGKALLPTPALELDRATHGPALLAHLLARVFAIDVTTCPCGGRLKIVEAVLDPDAIALHLHGARAPPRPPPHGQLSLLPT